MSWQNFGASVGLPSVDCSGMCPVSSLSTGQKKCTNAAMARCGFRSQLQSGFMKGCLKGSGIRPSERTTRLMSSSVAPTHSQAASNEREAGNDSVAECDSSRTTHKIFSPACRQKSFRTTLYIRRNSVGVGGVQNRRSELLRGMPLRVPIEGPHQTKGTTIIAPLLKRICLDFAAILGSQPVLCT